MSAPAPTSQDSATAPNPEAEYDYLRALIAALERVTSVRESCPGCSVVRGYLDRIYYQSTKFDNHRAAKFIGCHLAPAMTSTEDQAVAPRPPCQPRSHPGPTQTEA